MKKKLSAMAKRYQMAHAFAMATLPEWKRLAVIQDLAHNHESRYVIDFCKEVIALAENLTFKEKGVPSLSSTSKTEQMTVTPQRY